VKLGCNGHSIKDNFPFLGNLVSSAGYTSDYIGKWCIGATYEEAGKDG
jgi:arylsulfatase A-like enzyme